MSNPTIPQELRCWTVTLDAAGWQNGANWANRLSLGRTDSLVQLRHRALPLVIDLDWFDPDAPEGQRGLARNGGKFRLRVVQNDDWENPIDGFHLTDPAGLDDALRRMIVRYG